MRDHTAAGHGHAGQSGRGDHSPQREHERRHEMRHRHENPLAAAAEAFARHGGFGPRGGMGQGGPGGTGRAERGPRAGGRGGRRGPGYGHDAAAPSTEGLAGWLTGRLPGDWFLGAPELSIDRDEVGIVGTLPAVELEGSAAGDSDTERAAAEAGRIQRFREQTRDQRIEIASEIESKFGRSVAWGAIAGDTSELFSNLSVPVMTRLRQPERQVLDTLVDGGVARSRSDALAWCVRLVGKNSESWLAEIREALTAVEAARANGPE